MSCYQQIVVDLPLRCQELLAAFFDKAKWKDSEVTFLLSLAETSIVIPYERLKEPSVESMKCPHCRKVLGLCPICGKELKPLPQSHPSGDRERLSEASKEMDSFKNTVFIGSAMWPYEVAGSWRCAKLKSVDELDFVKETELKGAEGGKKAWTVLKHIRNALAHANIFTVGGRVIEKIVFLSSRGCSEWDYLSVTPDDFKTFLGNWMKVLATIRISEGLTPDSDIEELFEAVA